MNLPNYIDLDQEYFIERAEEICRSHPDWTEQWSDATAFAIWTDYQKFYSQEVKIGMFVPCSVKLEEPVFPVEGYEAMKASISPPPVEVAHMEALDAYEASGKPLEKPEDYDRVSEKTAESPHEFQEYHEAEQRTLFTGWELRQSDFNDTNSLITLISEDRQHMINSPMITGTLSNFQSNWDKIPLPLNESNKTIQKLFLSEVKV